MGGKKNKGADKQSGSGSGSGSGSSSTSTATSTSAHDSTSPSQSESAAAQFQAHLADGTTNTNTNTNSSASASASPVKQVDKNSLSVSTSPSNDSPGSGNGNGDGDVDSEEEDAHIGGHPPMDAPSPHPSVSACVPLSTLLHDESRDKSMDLSRIGVDAAKHDTSGRVYRVYSDGVFDLFHLGHMRMLEQAKKSLGDVNKVYLMCGVCDDEMVHKYKGKTVMNHKLRCDSVSHCKWVDQVVPDAPWVITDEFIAKYGIDFVAHDALPYADVSGAASSGDVYQHIKEKGMFLETQRTDGLSTSDLIVQIVRDYDDYVTRNLDRGYTKEQLNVGATWELRSKMHVKNKNLKAAVDHTKASYKETSDAIKAFVAMFNPKYLLHRSESKRRVEMKPRAYYQHLKTTIPQKRSDIIHHSVGLARAVVSSSMSLLSYLNLASYCRKSKPRKKD